MIFEQDLKKERQQKWRVSPAKSADYRDMRTLDDAREFLNTVGFCLAYPVKPGALAPTFIGAYVGSDEKLPTAKLAFADANARSATELVVRLLSEKAAFEVAFGDDGSLLVSAAEFPYFYALVGDRNPKSAPSPGPRGEQALTTHTFEVIDQFGPINEDEMRRKLEREISRNAIEKVLHALWSKLRITRVDAGFENGEPVEPIWDMMHRWAPEMVNRGKQISAAEALSALISKYLETVISAEQKDIEDFFSRLVPRSRVTEVIKALMSAQEFTMVQVSGKNMLRLASRGGNDMAQTDSETTGADAVPLKVHKVRPWQAREQGKQASFDKKAKYAARGRESGPDSRPPNAFQKFSKDRPAKPFGERKSFGDRPKPFGDRKPLGERKSFGDGPKSFGKRKSFGDKPRFGKDRPPRDASSVPERGRGFKKPFGESKSFGDRPKSFGDRKPLGERKSFGDRPKSFGERKSFGDKPRFSKDRPPRRDATSAQERGSAQFGERKTFGGKNRPSHGRERFAPKSGGGFAPRRSFGAEGPERNAQPRRDSERGEKRPGAFKKDYAPRPKTFGDKKPFAGKKSFGDKKSFGAKKSFGGPRGSAGKKSFGKGPGRPRREESSE